MSDFISLFIKAQPYNAFKTYTSAIMIQINLSLETNIMATGVGNKSLIQADCAKLLDDIKLSETCKS